MSFLIIDSSERFEAAWKAHSDQHLNSACCVINDQNGRALPIDAVMRAMPFEFDGTEHRAQGILVGLMREVHMRILQTGPPRPFACVVPPTMFAEEVFAIFIQCDDEGQAWSPTDDEPALDVEATTHVGILRSYDYPHPVFLTWHWDAERKYLRMLGQISSLMRDQLGIGFNS